MILVLFPLIQGKLFPGEEGYHDWKVQDEVQGSDWNPVRLPGYVYKQDLQPGDSSDGPVHTEVYPETTENKRKPIEDDVIDPDLELENIILNHSFDR